MEEVPNLINICPTNRSLNLHEFFEDFVCPSNDTFEKIKKMILVLGLHSKDRRSTLGKSNIGNPKLNRGCTPLASNCTSADCDENSLGPSLRYIPLGTTILGVSTLWFFMGKQRSAYMMTSSNGNIFHITGHFCGEFIGPGEFPTQRPVKRSFDVFFDLCLNKRLSKQWWGWWFEMLSCPLWSHRNGIKDLDLFELYILGNSAHEQTISCC